VSVATVLLTIAIAFSGFRRPLARLERAAHLLSRGLFDKCIAEIGDVARRGDEIGAVARALKGAAEQLDSAMSATRALSRNLTEVVASIDRAARTLSSDAEATASGLGVASSGFNALIGSTKKLVDGLNQSQSTVAELANAASSVDRATVEVASAAYVVGAAVGRMQRMPALNSDDTIRTLSAKVDLLRKNCDVARESVHTCLDLAMAFRRRINDDLMLQLREKQHGDTIHQALTDLGAVSQRQVKQAASLERISSELRRDFAKLAEVLAAAGDSTASPPASLEARRAPGGANKPSLTVVRRSAS
jgi:hypothetical protein